jgi:hypothetical protein
VSLPVASRDVAPLLATVARLLATGGAGAVDDVLAVARAALGCSVLRLRSSNDTTPADLRPVPAQGGPDRWELDLPVRAHGQVTGVLTAVADRPFTATQGQALGGVADLLALAVASSVDAHPAEAESAVPAGRSVLDAEADLAQAAGDLHATVGRALVTIRYAADQVAAGHADPRSLDEPIRAAIGAFRQVHRDLRAHALEAGLRIALREIALREGGDRPDDGRPPLTVTVDADDPGLDAVPPAVAVAVQRVAEAALRGATGHAQIVAKTTPGGVKLTLECADIAYDASELDRWGRRVSALGGHLRPRPQGVDLELPVQTRAEGHHDDGPDL